VVLEQMELCIWTAITQWLLRCEDKIKTLPQLFMLNDCYSPSEKSGHEFYLFIFHIRLAFKLWVVIGMVVRLDLMRISHSFKPNPLPTPAQSLKEMKISGSWTLTVT
jgi:hypothetical protein